MTPTLAGRWQTRIFLTVAVGLPVTIPFALAFLGVPVFVLGVVLVIGLICDLFYDRWQRTRWDHDWPVHLQVVAGAIEFGVLSVVLCCPLGAIAGPAVVVVPFHYLTVWLAMFAFVQGPIRALFPKWRFRGGRIL